MLKYTIQDDDSQVVTPKPGSTDPLQGKVSMHVTFTDHNNDESAVQYFEVESLDPVVIDSELKSAAIAYNEKVLVQEAQEEFSNPFDTLTIGDPVEFDDDGTPGTASITGVVWIDNDRDGIRDDVGRVVGASVELRMAVDNSVVDTVTTNANGIYTFTAVENGAYYLHFDTPSGYAITLQNQGADDTLDSDINSGTGNTANFNVANDEEITGYDAGMYQLGTIAGVVWNDVDQDGIRDAGETTGILGSTVELHLVSDDSLVDSVVTAAPGAYAFTDVAPGDYYVQFGVIADYSISPQNQGADDTVDSDAYPGTGKTGTITVNAGSTITNVDCGMYLTPVRTINGSIFDDWDRDGTWDVGDESLFTGSNITVKLYAYPTNSLVDTTTTGSTGLFEILAPYDGDFYLEVTTPTDYEVSPAAGDNDFDPATKKTAFFSIEGGETITRDCGLMHELGYVDAHVFVDDGAGGGTGDNGVQDGTELDWLTGGGVFLRVTHPLGGFNDAYPEVADGTIHLQVRSGTGLTATWMFVDAYATGYHITGGTNPETINVTANSTTDLGDRGVAAD